MPATSPPDETPADDPSHGLPSATPPTGLPSTTPPHGLPSYEDARAELREIVSRLETGGQSLEDSLALWERGEQLADICQTWLDDAGQRLERAIGERDVTDRAGADRAGADHVRSDRDRGK